MPQIAASVRALVVSCKEDAEIEVAHPLARAIASSASPPSLGRSGRRCRRAVGLVAAGGVLEADLRGVEVPTDLVTINLEAALLLIAAALP